MKIKTFTARTFGEALDLVKKELSENAVILSTEEKKGLRPHVEVTAAVDYELEECEMRQAPAREHSAIRKELVPMHISGQSAIDAPLPPHRTGVDELKNEIADLKKTLEGMKKRGYEMALPARKKAALDFLTQRAVREEYALRVSEGVKDLNDIPLLLSSDIRVKGATPGKKAVMLIGPTGVGKTTTVAKLSAAAVKAGRKAAVVSLDTYRIGAVEQVRIYSRILGIPLAIATSAAELTASLARFSESRDLVFIDTTGRNPLDEQYLAQIAEVCSGGVPIELHLLMNANGDDAFLMEAYKAYRRLPIDYLAFSKIDEAVRYGSLYNLILTYQKPVSCITTGQQVPGDIEFPTPARLAGLIVSLKEC